MQVTGHTALITGGTRGIGAAIAAALKARGNRVLITGRDPHALDRALAEGHADAAYRIDFSDGSAVTDLMSLMDTDKVYPTLLVNNAGAQDRYSLLAAADVPARFEAEVALNLFAPVRLTDALLEILCDGAPGSAIVNVSSGLALAPKEASPSYCASKAALHSYSQVLRWQLEARRVRVFELLPPRVETAMTAASGGEKLSPADVAADLLSAMSADQFEIYPGMAASMRDMLRTAPEKALAAIRHM